MNAEAVGAIYIAGGLAVAVGTGWSIAVLAGDWALGAAVGILTVGVFLVTHAIRAQH